MIKNFNTLFVTMFGLGKIKIIPGTFGSLATIIMLYIFFHLIKISSHIILLFLISVFIYSFIAVASYIKESENKDPKEVIIDEFIGQSIPIYLYEISHGTQKTSEDAIIFYGICFILFRFFDILKPGIIGKSEKLKGATGIMMDDWLSGLFSAAIIFVLFIFGF